jgi:hypothetical protein
MRLLSRCYSLALILFLTTSVVGKSQNIQADSVRSKLNPESADGQFLERGISYFFLIQSGALIGCNDCDLGKEVTFSTATIHGINLGKKFKIGAGLGFDAYSERQAIPVFGSVSYDLVGNRNSNSVLIQLNYGWAKSEASKAIRDYGYKGSEGGRMINAQLGYRIKYGDLRISLAIGYKSQKTLTHYEYPNYTSVEGRWVEGVPSSRTIEEELRKFQVTMAIGRK